LVREEEEEDRIEQPLLRIYKEYWTQARHCENERLWFTQIYVVVMAGILGFLSDILSKNPLMALALLFTLMLLTIIGYFVAYALSYTYIRYTRLADLIMLEVYGIKRDYVYDFSPIMKRHPKRVKFMDIFMIFYSAMMALLSSLSLTMYLLMIDVSLYELGSLISIASVAIGVFLMLLLLYKFKLRRDYEKFLEAVKQRVKNICQL